MGRNQRIGLLVGAVVVVVIAVIVIGGGSDSSRPRPRPARRPSPSSTASRRAASRRSTYKKGDTVDLTVKSDTADEIHIHGYDLHKDVTKGGSVHFTFPASIDGKFVVELEAKGEQIASLAGRAVSRRLRAAGALAPRRGARAARDRERHGLVGKQDLPIPRWLFAWGAAIVLVISFVGLADAVAQAAAARTSRERRVLRACRVAARGAERADRRRDLRDRRLRGPRRRCRPRRRTSRRRSSTSCSGSASRSLSLLFGDVFRPFNPWLAIGRGTGWLVKRVAARAPSRCRIPSGSAAGRRRSGILAFAWVELVYANKADPSTLSI